MYSVWIADDEGLVIESLRHSVDWAALNLRLAGCSTDGPDALACIARERPDIAIADIRMPGLNGLELMDRARSASPETLFVIISGYAEFEYARQAITYGAMGYCLKPVEPDELRAALSAALAKLDERRSHRADELLCLVEPGAMPDEPALRALMARRGLDHRALWLAVAIGRTQPPAALAPARLGMNEYLCLGSGDLRHAERQLIAIEGLRGAGLVACGGADTIADDAKAATELAYLYFAQGEGRVFTALPDDRDAVALIAEVRQLCYRRDEPGIARRLARALADMPQYGRCFRLRHAIQLYNLLADNDGPVYDYAQFVARFADLKALLAALAARALGGGQADQPAQGDRLAAVLAYVDRHYRENLSLALVAERTHINAGYISLLFRERMSTTFTQYLTGKKMTCARSLLRDTDLPIRRVAQDLGYADYFYFLRVFKKATGHSPGAYRKQARESATHP